MRRSLGLLPVVLLALTAAPACPQTEPATPTTTVPQKPAEQKTVVQGTLPDLRGRWLAIAWLDIPGARTRTVTNFFEVTRPGDTMVVTTHYGNLPPAEEAELNQANEANREWHPTPEGLGRIASAWDELPTVPGHAALVEHTLTGRDAFDQTYTAEARVRDAQWVLLQNETFDASAAPAVRQIMVYGVLEAKDGGYGGNYTSTLMAAAPFPIPITLQGRFQLVRLEASSGLLHRLADLFSGCGRRQ